MKIGDTVRLRGGGPVMTINALAWNLVTCVWITDKGNLRKATFHENALIAILSIVP